MPLTLRGFSLIEVLIAMAISSTLLLSTSRFLPGLQHAILLQSGERALEEEIWQRLFAIGKQLQRAGYCAGSCQGEGCISAGRAAALSSNGMQTATAPGTAPRRKTTARGFALSPARWNPCVARPRVKERDGTSSRTRTGLLCRNLS